MNGASRVVPMSLIAPFVLGMGIVAEASIGSAPRRGHAAQEKPDPKAARKEFRAALADAKDDPAARNRALGVLMQVQSQLEVPHDGITEDLGESLADADFGVRVTAAEHLASGHSPKAVFDVLEDGLKEAAKSLGSIGFDEPQHAASQTALCTLFRTTGGYRDDRAQKLLLRFLDQHRMILHGDALQTLADVLLAYETVPALEGLLDYHEEAESSGFGRLLRSKLADGLREIGAKHEMAPLPMDREGAELARSWKRWLKKEGRRLEKRLGKLPEPRR